MRALAPLYTWAGDLAVYARRVEALKPGDAAIVVSDNSGPGTVRDPALMQHIAELAERDITVLGYVAVGYGARTVDAVLDDIAAWHRLYGVTRLFIDEWPTDWGMRHLGCCWGAVRGYAGRGTPDKPILVVNPGTDLPLNGTPPDGTLVVTYEGSDPSDRFPKPWEAILVYGCPTPDAMRWRLHTNGWRFGYCTSDGADGNPWDE